MALAVGRPPTFVASTNYAHKSSGSHMAYIQSSCPAYSQRLKQQSVQLTLDCTVAVRPLSDPKRKAQPQARRRQRVTTYAYTRTLPSLRGHRELEPVTRVIPRKEPRRVLYPLHAVVSPHQHLLVPPPLHRYTTSSVLRTLAPEFSSPGTSQSIAAPSPPFWRCSWIRTCSARRDSGERRLKHGWLRPAASMGPKEMCTCWPVVPTRNLWEMSGASASAGEVGGGRRGSIGARTHHLSVSRCSWGTGSDVKPSTSL